jgi:hypothetical protein
MENPLVETGLGPAHHDHSSLGFVQFLLRLSRFICFKEYFTKIPAAKSPGQPSGFAEN